jgi:uncharacterized membrane protein YjjP (DUF1212 family)
MAAMVAATPVRAHAATEVQSFLLELGVAMTMTGDAVSEIQGWLRGIAGAYGFPHAQISVGPTFVIVALGDGQPAGMRTIDSFGQLTLGQASDVIRLARRVGEAAAPPELARDTLRRILAARPRVGAAGSVVAHAVLTIGLGLVIHPAAVDLWVYAALGALVGVMKVAAARFGTGGYLLPVLAAAAVSAIAFLAHGDNQAASLRLTIPPLVTFLPGALLTMATVDLAMGETVAGASRFVAALIQLALLGIGIIIGAELVGDPHGGPVAGSAADTLGAWSPWLGVVVFGVGVYVHNVAPQGSLRWLLLVLLVAFSGQVVGELLLGASLSGFVGATAMVPFAHLVSRWSGAPPAHVMFLPAFWLLVPGTLGLIGMAELFGENAQAGWENLGGALLATGSVALGVLVGVMVVRAARSVVRAMR